MSGKQRRARLNDIASIAGALREPVETPDFTSSILERVHAEKPFIAPRTRRWVPLVRIGAASVGVLGVFAMTLIVFVRPELPEQLGADRSVTTDLVQSAETGVTNKVAGVLETIKIVGRATDPRALLNADAAPRTVQASQAIAAAPEPAFAPAFSPAFAPASRETLTGMTVSITTMVAAPLPMPMEVVFPQAASEASDYAAFTRASFAVDTRFASDDRSGAAPWQRAAMVSQPWGGRAAGAGYLASFRPSIRPRLNPESPMLLKELFPLITGQPAGDELQIR